MDFVLPQISISPPPFEEPVVEPYSPFSSLSPICTDKDTFRSVHLTPPLDAIRSQKRSSLLRSREDVTSPHTGLERKRFEALLQSSRERNSIGSTKRAANLRKEISLKAHNGKQDERRAFFLSKVLVPPSPTAALTSNTPPDSPAVFHYSPPSPGLISPLSLLKSLDDDETPFSRKPWVEQADFCLEEFVNMKELPPCSLTSGVGGSLPSLDQISARLNPVGYVHSRPQTRTTRLPRFLTLERSREQPSLKQAPKPSFANPLKLLDNSHSSIISAPTSLNSRERRALDMLTAIRRRTQASDDSLYSDTNEEDGRKSHWKRHSAPADLTPHRQRTGFEPSVLALPGGF